MTRIDHKPAHGKTNQRQSFWQIPEIEISGKEKPNENHQPNENDQSKEQDNPYEQSDLTALNHSSGEVKTVCQINQISVVNHNAEQNQSKTDYRIRRLKDKLQEDLARNWTIAEMAQTVNLSTSHLHKLFKTEAGVSPLQYLRSLRLDRARELIENSFAHIKEIRLLIGIPDKSNFIRDFKARFGITPDALRQERLKNQNSK